MSQADQENGPELVNVQTQFECRKIKTVLQYEILIFYLRNMLNGTYWH